MPKRGRGKKKLKTNDQLNASRKTPRSLSRNTKIALRVVRLLKRRKRARKREKRSLMMNLILKKM